MFPKKRCCWETFSFWASEHWWHEDFIFLGTSIFIYFQGLRLRWTSIVHNLRVDSTGLYVKEVDLLFCVFCPKRCYFSSQDPVEALVSSKIERKGVYFGKYYGYPNIVVCPSELPIENKLSKCHHLFFLFLKGWGFMGGGLKSLGSKFFASIPRLKGGFPCLTCVLSWIKKEWLKSPQSYGIHKNRFQSRCVKFCKQNILGWVFLKMTMNPGVLTQRIHGNWNVTGN